MSRTKDDQIREALTAVAYGSWAPEAQRPDARVALFALVELEERCARLSEEVGRMRYMLADATRITVDYDA